MSKKALTVKLIILIIAFILVAAICAAFIGFFPFGKSRSNNGWFGFRNGSGEMKLVSTDIYDADSYSSIEVNTASYDISVASGTDEITVKYYSNSTDDDDSISVSPKGSTIVVNGSDKKFFGFNNVCGKIEVTVPESSAYNFTLSSASGDITFDCSAAQLQFNSASGNINCVSESAGRVNLSSISGDIYCSAQTSEIRLNTTSGNIRNAVACESIFANSVSGDVELSLSDVSKSCSIETVSGSIDLALSGTKDYSVDFSTVSGDLDDSIDNRKSDGDTRYTVGSGALVISADSVSGDMEIK